MLKLPIGFLLDSWFGGWTNMVPIPLPTIFIAPTSPRKMVANCSAGMAVPNGHRFTGKRSSKQPYRGNRKNTGNNLPQGEWLEAVGYAVTAAALGAGAFHERCFTRAHVYQSADVRNRVFGRAGRFTSFVVDT